MRREKRESERESESDSECERESDRETEGDRERERERERDTWCVRPIQVPDVTVTVVIWNRLYFVIFNWIRLD